MEVRENSLEIARILREVLQMYKQNVHKIYEKSGFTAPQGMVMQILVQSKKMKIHELSDRLKLSNSTVSGIVDRLENQGLVERTRSEDDKRVVYVSLSTKFEEMFLSFKEVSEKSLGEFLSGGTDEELTVVMKGLNILKRLMKQEK